MKRNLLFLLIILVYNHNILLAQCSPNSGPTKPCDSSKEYPYRFCEDGKIITKCTSEPNSFSNIIKVDLPIRIKLTNWYYYEFVGGSPIVGEPTGMLLSSPHNQNEMDLAANKWNCICGYNTSDGKGTTILGTFSPDWRKFKNPYNDPSCYNKESICYSSDNVVYFNISNAFQYAEPVPDESIPIADKPISHLIMNDYWIHQETNYKDVYTYVKYVSSRFQKDFEIYNLVDVAMHQIGEILGMGWSEECGCLDDYAFFSIMSPDFISQVNGWIEIPNYVGLGGINNESYGDCDKCMFQKLYCLDAASVYEYEPQEQNLYPNPAYKKVNIDFTVQKYTENLKMTIMNSIGQIVIVIKENKTYDAGKYSETINVDNLTAGTYYLIIETDYSSKKIKPFVVTSQ